METQQVPRLEPVRDLEEMAAALRGGVTVEYVQLEPGPFVGWWSVVPVASVDVQFGGTDVSVVRRISVPHHAWVTVIPIAMPSPARWNGMAVRGGEVITLPPGSLTYAFDPPGSRYAHVVLADSAATSLTWDTPSALVTPHGTVIGQKLCESQTIRSESAHRRMEIVARAEDYVHRHAGEAVSIARLSAESGVSERSLRNAFYEVCAVAPKRYLRARSLHQVRRALIGEAASVTDVATLHGFFELGRFAGQYKALFGETPSETLQKARDGVRRLPLTTSAAPTRARHRAADPRECA